MKRMLSFIWLLLLPVVLFAQTNIEPGAGKNAPTPPTALSIDANAIGSPDGTVGMPKIAVPTDGNGLKDFSITIEDPASKTAAKKAPAKDRSQVAAATKTYTITVNSHGSFGYTAHGADVIRNSTRQYTVTEGSSFNVTAYPNYGYRVAYIRTQRSGFIGVRSDYSDNTNISHSASISSIKEDGTIDVYFEAISYTKSSYTVTVNSHGYYGYTTHGSDRIRNSSRQYTVTEGSSFSVTGYPDDGYRVSHIITQESGYIGTRANYIDNTSISHSASLYSIKGNGTIDVYFEKIPAVKPTYTITVNSHGNYGYTAHGSDKIRNSSKQYTVEEGGSINVVAYPDEGYRVAYIRTQKAGFIGTREDFMDSYTISHSGSLFNIKEDGTIDAYFEKLPTQDISFADATVKAICVRNWDTNGDGELDMNEAAAVKSLGTAFQNSQISTFNELRYFTGLTAIDGSFSNSTVKQLTIPVNVTRLGKDAFLYCRSLTSIHLPAKVQTLGQNALSGCTTMTTITVDDSNDAFCSVDGVLFNKAKTRLLQFPAAKTTAYTVPEGTQVVGIDAFFASKVESVLLPSTLKTIDYDAFGYCRALTELVIPEGVTTIADYILDHCTALTRLVIPSTVKTIGSNAFNYCTKISYINIPDIAAWCSISFGENDSNPITYAHNIYINGEKVTDLAIPFGVKKIAAKTFYNCSGLTSLTLPTTLSNIGNNAFYGCTGLTSVTVESPVPATIYENSFTNRKNATLYVPFGSKSAYQAAAYWKEFKSIVEYGKISFADAKTKAICVKNWDSNGDGELTLSEAAAVKSLGTAFQNSQISTFNELQFFTGLTSIDGAFSYSTLKEVTLPETVTALNKDAFLYCKSLLKIHLSAGISFIGQNALSGCSTMTEITVDENNKVFCDIDGVLFSKDKTQLVQFPAAKATTYVIPEGTKVLGRDAFYMSKLTNVTLPSTLEELGYDAFGYSTALTELIIPEGVITIGDYILDGCKSVTTLRIPSTVTTIGKYMARSCYNITDVYCDIKKPFGILENNFTATVYGKATLHVLAFLEDTYKALDGWKNFSVITDDLTDYVVAADALSLVPNKEGELNVNLHNSGDVDGIQFDFSLPAGVKVASDEYGLLMVSTTDRSSKLSAQCVKISDTQYRILLFSTKRAIISSGEGTVLKVSLSCDNTIKAGDYEIAFSSLSLSCVDGDMSVNVNVDDFASPLTIEDVSTMEGDADGNFTVDVTDVMMIVNHILNRFDSRFIFANADLDSNGIVNVTDAMNVVNIILNKPSAAPAHAKRMDCDLLGIGTTETGCQLLTAYDSPQITALQMTVTLPDGCRMRNAALAGEASRTHKMMRCQLDDRTYRVVVFSTSSAPLDADAAFMTFDLEGNGGLVSVEDILCTDTNLETLTSPDLTAVLTGIGTIIADGDDAEAPVYNLAGQRMSQPRRGVNITKGMKVVVK